MARLFPGSTATDIIRVTQQAAINSLSPLSLSVWVLITALDATNRRILDKTNLAASPGTGEFRWRINATTILFNATRWGTTVGNWTCPTPTSLAGAWAHLCLAYAYTATTDDPLIYINGVAQTVTRGTTPVGIRQTDSIDLAIGDDQSGSAFCFNGSMAEVAMWPRLLNATEVAFLAAGADPRTIQSAFLRGYWPLCGVSSPEPDYSGNGNNGVVTGTSASPHPGSLISPCNGGGSSFASEEAGVGFCPSNKDSAVTVW